LNRDDVEFIPASLGLAVERFKTSDRMKDFFGEVFCEVFAGHRQFDLEKARAQVADWERKKFLENA
jgi:glutamine synthetase